MEKLKRLFTERNMFIVFAFGFSSGLPFILIKGAALQAWAKNSGLDLREIGLLNLVGLPYSLKFIWSPLLDRFIPPFWGRRRGWIAITQIGIVLSLVLLATISPAQNKGMFAFAATLVAIFAATQDIAIDAHRREALPTSSFGFGSSLYIMGFRLAMIFGGGGALAMADFLPWRTVYLIMAAVVALGLIADLFAIEPKVEFAPPRNWQEAVVDPFFDFFKRKEAFWILGFLLLYKLGDNLALAMTTPMYMDAGYTKTEIAVIAKTFGVWAVIAGGLIGGTLMLYIGLRRALWIFGFFQALAILGFAALAWLTPFQPNELALALIITIENLAIGMSTAAFTTFMANLTNKRFTATQYALLTSFMAAPRDLISAGSGFLAQSFGYEGFFILCSLVTIPGVLMLIKVGHWADGDGSDPSEAPSAAS